MNLSIRSLIPLLIFLLIAGAFAIGLTKDPNALPSQMIDRSIPNFELTDLFDDTRTYTRADLQGEVSLVNVFGSWCAACVQEHPMLVKLSRDDTIQLIGVNWRDKRDKAKRWLERYDNPYAKIIFDESSLLAIDLGVTGAPETFLIDKAGNIRYKHVGIITPEVWETTLRPRVKQLQAQP